MGCLFCFGGEGGGGSRSCYLKILTILLIQDDARLFLTCYAWNWFFRALRVVCAGDTVRMNESGSYTLKFLSGGSTWLECRQQIAAD